MKITNFSQSPYLISYTPPSSPAGTVFVTKVEDMVTYNISSSLTSSINYSVGAQNSYGFNLVVKNVTTTTEIELILSGSPYFTITSSSVTLLPMQQKNIPISISRYGLDADAGIVDKPFSIQMYFTNKSGSIALKNTLTTIPSQSTLPSTIQIT